MSRMTILTEADLRKIVRLDLDAVACVENAFRALATLPVAMPPIMRLDIPEHRGEVDVKTAYVPGIDAFAIKISPGFFDNPKLGLPSVNGMMVLLSAKTGLVEALLLDNGYLTDIRTAAAGAVAAKYLARDDAAIAAIFGAGVQARLQLEALTLVRPIREARIWARDAAKAEAAAASLGEALGIVVRAEADPQQGRRRGRHRGHDDARRRADPARRLALARPACHRDGIGCRAQERTRPGPDFRREPLCGRQPAADAPPRRTASRHRGGPRRCRYGFPRSSDRSSPDCDRGAKQPRTLRLPISPAPASRTPRSPRWHATVRGQPMPARFSKAKGRAKKPD